MTEDKSGNKIDDNLESLIKYRPLAQYLKPEPNWTIGADLVSAFDNHAARHVLTPVPRLGCPAEPQKSCSTAKCRRQIHFRNAGFQGRRPVQTCGPG